MKNLPKKTIQQCCTGLSRYRFNYLLLLLFALSSFSLIAQDAANGSAAGTTGGQGGETVTVNTLSALTSYASSSNSYIILVQGTILSSSNKTIDVQSNKTIVGLGTDAALSNIELRIIDQHNIIIRNLTIKDSYVEGDWDGKTQDYDGVQSDRSYDIWIDHCHFTHIGDGCIDLRDGTDDVTVSWTKFSNHNKTFGIGWTDETGWNVTIHHCYFDGTGTRNPSFDQGRGHLYNNYLRNITSYGNLARGNARVIVENSRFDYVNDPLLITDNGVLYSSGNSFNSCTGNKSGNTSSKPWTPGYSYTLDDPSYLRVDLQEGTGPQSYISDQYTGNSDPTNTIFNGTFSLVASHSGKALDTYAWGTTNGTNIVQWDYWGGEAQQFNITSVDGIWHRITPVISSGQALDVYGISTQDGANINTWEYWGGNGQQFRFQGAGSGVWRIINRNSEKCIDIEAGSTADGANAFQWTCISGATNQMFQVINRKSTSKPMTETDEVSVYPNPATDYINVELPGSLVNASVNILDQSGRIVLTTSVSKDNNIINIATLSGGVYFIQVNAPTQTFTNKLLIK